MSTLNEDVVQRVIDTCDPWCPEDLCSIALISSAWVQPVRKLLYVCPTLTTYKSCHHLARTLEGNPALIPLIRGLDIFPSGGEILVHEGSEEHTPESRSGPSRLLELTRLESLTLGGDLAMNAERFLLFVGSPHTVKSLRIISPALSGDRIVRQGSLAWDGDFPLRFHSLVSLSLDGPLILDIDETRYIDPDSYKDTVKSGMHDTSAPTVPRGCILKELHLRGVRSSEGCGTVCALVHEPAAWRHLRRLTFTFENHGTKENTSFAHILQKSSSSLEDLIIESRHGIEGPGSDWVAPRFPRFIRDDPPHLSQLKSLKTSYILLNNMAIRSIISESDVELLDIKGASEFSVVTWVPDIHTNDYPRLKKLILRLGRSQLIETPSNVGLHNAIQMLAGACQSRGIEFVGVVHDEPT